MNKEKRDEALKIENEKLYSLCNAAGEGSAYKRAQMLFDAGTFVETGRFVKARITAENRELDEYEGVVTGYGAIDGRLVFAFVQDMARTSGAFGESAAKKIVALIELAKKNGAALVGVFASAGARVGEGADVLSAYASVMKAISDVKGKIPVFSVVLGNNSGCASTLSALSDFVIMSKKDATLSATAASVLATMQENKEIGGALYCAEKRTACALGENDADCFAKLRELISFIPSNCEDKNIYVSYEDDANRQTGELEALLNSANYDVKQLIAAVSDCGKYFELYAESAKKIVCAFALVGGIPTGIVANAPALNGGKLGSGAMAKAAEFVEFCNSFGIPVITFVSSEGFCDVCESKGGSLVANSAKLSLAYASASVPLVTVYTGACYGAAFALMAPKTLGADIAYALPCAKIAAMAPESAVAFLWGERLANGEDRAALCEEWETVNASPINACAHGAIDDIVSYAELRQKIASALEMLSMKKHFETL